MANQIGEGQWQGLDGKIYASEGEANTQSGNVVLNNTSGGGGAMGGLAGGFLAIFIIGPILIAKLVGFLWGLLLKLGIVGRVLTTGLMLIAGPFMAMIIMGLSQELFRGLGRVGSGIVIVSAALLPAAWYFLWHYDAVKLMGASTFSAKIGNFAKFVWFGFLGACLLAFFKGNEALRAVVSLGASIAGVIFYLISTIGYAREASQNPTIKIPLAIKGIVMAAVVGLIVIYGIAAKAEVAGEKKEYALAAAQFKTGMTVIVTENRAQIYDPVEKKYTGIYGTPITDEPVPMQFDVTVLKYVKQGDILTVTGEPQNEAYNYWLVPVEHEGTKGWIEVEYITPKK